MFIKVSFLIIDCQNSFGIIFKSHADDKDKLYSFMLDETNVDKALFLTSLAKSIAQTKCLPDHVSGLYCLELYLYMCKALIPPHECARCWWHGHYLYLFEF